ncbi:hypothetical protein QBC36DRAFT_102870 [Triangularia setosa]|uniref:Uncharacterized protein n=1 Tax=Triangularia setosa TaxID=2587417 RepID=A0AAN6VXR3_9PEZI|nr:hypothetical protein QBC36DRAFT_102870 [Podospora setosa]
MSLFRRPDGILRSVRTRWFMMSNPCQASGRHIHTSAQIAASELLTQVKGHKFTRRQFLDGNQLQKLSLTLGRRTELSTEEPPDGTPLPYGYHLVYFTPSQFESFLGADGSDTTFNSPAPFTRRMWAGGEMEWNPDIPLKIGDRVEETTEILDAKAKKSRDGSEMILVDVEKRFVAPQGLALTDRRSWIFRQPLAAPPPASSSPIGTILPTKSHIEDVSSPETEFITRRLVWSPVALFQFSALTFNAHMIHFNESWTRQVEGHPNVVVHGPLNLINLMNYWRDCHAHQGGEVRAKGITYRALSPLYAGEEYTIGTESVEDSGGETRYGLVVKRGDVVCMRGEVMGVKSS